MSSRVKPYVSGLSSECSFFSTNPKGSRFAFKCPLILYALIIIIARIEYRVAFLEVTSLTSDDLEVFNSLSYDFISSGQFPSMAETKSPFLGFILPYSDQLAFLLLSSV